MQMLLNGVNRVTLLLTAAVLLTALGCAQEIGDINRVQANALSKADFANGEWYILQTITEVPPASVAGFEGYSGMMEKIRWEITEDYLIGYRSYENNPGSRPEASSDLDGDYTYEDYNEEGYNPEYLESPIVAYPIISHFDIQRSYNTSTGEQTNVLVENSSDRLWYEREYFRVDWTNVLETELMFDNWFTNSISWYVQPSENSVDSLVMDYFDSSNIGFPGIEASDYPNGQLYYMDFTNRVVLDPGYSYCWGGWQPITLDDCAANEVEMRTSVLRVPASSDYEAIHYDDVDQAKFGYFRTERLIYDRELGERLSNQVLLANRHNIWSDTWQTDASGNVLRQCSEYAEDITACLSDNPEGYLSCAAPYSDIQSCMGANTADALEQCVIDNPASSACGQWGHAIAQPMADRTPEPIVYHVNLNYPENLWDATMNLATNWDRAFRRAVGAAQNRSADDVDTMFILCHNPVTADDDPACGSPGTMGRIGDLRFNYIHWVHAPQASGPLGYGPSNADPETGELITGTAFVYGGAVDTYSEYATQIVRFMNGDLDIEDLQDAEFIREQLRERVDPNIDPRARISTDVAHVRVDEMDLREMIPESAQDFLGYVDEFGMEDFIARPEWLEHRWDLIAESGFGALAVDSEMVNGFGVESLDELTPEVRDAYFRGGALMPRIITERRDRMERAASENIMLAENLDDTVIGLAQTYVGRDDYDVIRLEIRDMIYQAVTEHEVGHTIGLRHNFQGSYDSLNYFPRYWELKTAGVLGVDEASGNIDIVPFRVPRYLSDIYGIADLTPAQIEGQMREYQYSSIMDYSAGFATDLHGIGLYDEAAIIYAYTSGRDTNVLHTPTHPLFNAQERGYVEVFDNPGSSRVIFQEYEGLDSPGYRDILEVYHYSTVASGMAFDDGFEEGEDLVDFLLEDNSIPDPALLRARLADRSLVRWQEVVNQREADNANRPIEVPYLFMSDEWRGYRQSVRVWDSGADPLEQALNIIDRYRSYYPFDYFRRDRAGWSPYDVLSRVGSYYFMDLIDNYQRWLFGPGISNSRPDHILDNGWTFAAFASLNLMAEVMTTPSYGSYGYYEDDNTYFLQSYSERDSADLYVPPGEGRRPYSSYDASQGYNYWAYPNEAGQYWAYYAAVIVMSSSSSLGVRGADVDADFLAYSIPPYLVFEEEMTNLYNSLWLEDNGAIAPAVIQQDDGKPLLSPRLFSWITLSDNSIMDPETGYITTHVMNGQLDHEGDGPTIDVMNSFSQRYLPMLYGMAFFDTNYSLNFHDQARIYRLGSGEQLTPGEGYEEVRFCDPFSRSGVCYAALMETGTDTPSVAANLILQTAALYEASGNSAEWTIENNIELMNMMRGMYDVFGNSMD